jgi:flagellar protein FliT
MKTIDLYVSIAEASNHMVNAARASNWDALVDAEQECARRVAALREHQATAGNAADAGDEKRRINILGEILAHDAEIRELTSPWLKQLERFLAGSSRERRLGDTYRSEFG